MELIIASNWRKISLAGLVFGLGKFRPSPVICLACHSAAHLIHLLDLIPEVLEVEGFSFSDLLSELFGFFYRFSARLPQSATLRRPSPGSDQRFDPNWNSSNASTPSPVPMNLMGLPVT